MAIPHEIPVGVLQEPKFSGAWEGGGWPSPPLSSFFQVGGTLPPCAGPTGGHPPPPSGPGRAIPIKTPEFTNHSLYTGDSTRTTGFGHAKKNPVAGKGGRGVIPTPLLFFFSSGGTLPPCAGATGGHPPPPSGPGPVRAIIVWKSSQHETSRAGSYGSLMNYTRYYNAAQKTDTNNFINHGVNG